MDEEKSGMKRYSWIFGGLLLLASCTGDFKDINTDLSGVTDEDLQIDYNEHGIRLGIIQQGIYFNYDYGKEELAFSVDTESKCRYVQWIYA